MSRAGKIAPEQLPILFVKNLKSAASPPFFHLGHHIDVVYSYEVSSAALWKLFDPGEDGLIRQIRQGISVEAKGTAYVVFWNVMDAKNALEKLNGYNFQNRYLVVLWHQPEKTIKSKDDVQARKDNLAQLKQKHGID
ncbi:pre-mRNA branch site protein p14 [Xylariaceae sp. FL0662B]|nr:pre-mRNA branch site protein p14 [Xylariaceae sp. FL0662B]